VCGETRSVELFGIERRRGKSSRRAQCNPCRSSQEKARQEASPRTHQRKEYVARRDLEDPGWRKNYQLQRKYGLTLAEFNAMLAVQGGLCAICGLPETQVIRGVVVAMHVDHDHSCCPGIYSCGKCVRGLLCSKCNTGLGKFDDDRHRLANAIRYLADHKEWP